jgi:hypothetical protein
MCSSARMDILPLILQMHVTPRTISLTQAAPRFPEPPCCTVHKWGISFLDPSNCFLGPTSRRAKPQVKKSCCRWAAQQARTASARMLKQLHLRTNYGISSATAIHPPVPSMAPLSTDSIWTSKGALQLVTPPWSTNSAYTTRPTKANGTTFLGRRNVPFRTYILTRS